MADYSEFFANSLGGIAKTIAGNRQYSADLAENARRDQLARDTLAQSQSNSDRSYALDLRKLEAGGESFRPLVDPKERAAYGIPEDNRMPFELNTKTNELKGIGGGGTNISVNAGENAYEKKLNEGLAGDYLDINAQGRKGLAALNSLEIMKKAMADPNFNSGITGQASLAIKRGIVALGGDPTSVASMEVFNATANKMVLDAAGGSLGNQISNGDRSFIAAQYPNLSNTPQGNAALIDIGQKLAQRQMDVAALARQYAAAHGGHIDANFNDQLAQWAEANPLFPDTAQPAVDVPGPGAPVAPAVGAVEGGYRFKGGDPSNRQNWEPAQ